MRDVCQKLQRPYELTEDYNLNKETQERQPAFHGLEDMLLRWQYFQVDLYDQCSPYQNVTCLGWGCVQREHRTGQSLQKKKGQNGNLAACFVEMGKQILKVWNCKAPQQLKQYWKEQN